MFSRRSIKPYQLIFYPYPGFLLKTTDPDDATGREKRKKFLIRKKTSCLMKTRKRKAGKNIPVEEYIKAAKKGNRLAEQELFGPGFHASDRAYRSKKLYTRKPKHKGREL